MRIVKMSKVKFPKESDIESYFEVTLPGTVPPGKFRMTKGRISLPNGIEPEKRVLFSYDKIVHYMAESTSNCRINEDEHRDEFPRYFQIDINTLTPIDISLHEIEQRYHQETGEQKNLVQSRAWPIIANQIFEDNLWESLL